ncbi:uncharacterized protein MONBRDRAFT_5351 [Monosiga brevicollis MX1]|uniref:Rab-GAP TBC domain-containing protein n=1 Tax=Monosiga brevicollis TaxID=81824 RepID=A9UQQ7_MONBE|nr:uncharacterized protein MONBRDRAFT_5351 [Monosiga brevicollis MX1]EDQ92638.1 predicted protein [Monosiga brevicollis MX1]|eukprot:XP_001742400.1 hypothetical protein [Monosiga brevicollis MX1]
MPQRGLAMRRRTTNAVRRRVRALIEACDADPVDVRALRALATAENGFCNNVTRSQVWARLVGVDPSVRGSVTDVEVEDSVRRQLEVDVARSLWKYPDNINADQREVLRTRLLNIMLNILHEYPDLHYYQGFHDVTAVIMLTCKNDALTLAIMRRLVRCHLKNYLCSTMQPVIQQLELLPVLLQHLDPELNNFIQRAGVEPTFAVSWLITWFAHDIDELPRVQRLFDFLLSCHPLGIVYLIAAVVDLHRESIMAPDEMITGSADDFPFVYKRLTTLGLFDVERAIQTAHNLMHEVPVQQLYQQVTWTRATRYLLQASVTARYQSFMATIVHQPAHKASAADEFEDYRDAPASGLGGVFRQLAHETPRILFYLTTAVTMASTMYFVQTGQAPL